MKRVVNKDITLKYFQKYDLIPIWNFIKVTETLDLRYLLILDDYNELPELKNEISIDLWTNIYFEHLDTFDEPGQSKDARIKKNEFWVTYWKFVATKDRKLLTKIEILKRRISSFKDNTPKENDFEKQVMILENHYKRNIDIFSISAKRYFTILDSYKKEFDIHMNQKNIK